MDENERLNLRNIKIKKVKVVKETVLKVCNFMLGIIIIIIIKNERVNGLANMVKVEK